jgi:hypothetical protein
LPQNSFEEVFPEQSTAVESTKKSTVKHWMFSLQHCFAKVSPEKSRLVGSYLSTDLKNFSWSTVWSMAKTMAITPQQHSFQERVQE